MARTVGAQLGRRGKPCHRHIRFLIFTSGDQSRGTAPSKGYQFADPLSLLRVRRLIQEAGWVASAGGRARNLDVALAAGVAADAACVELVLPISMPMGAFAGQARLAVGEECWVL